MVVEYKLHTMPGDGYEAIERGEEHIGTIHVLPEGGFRAICAKAFLYQNYPTKARAFTALVLNGWHR